MPARHDFHIYRGDSFTAHLTIRRESDNAPIVLDGSRWVAQIRTSVRAETVRAEFVVDTAAAADGVLVLSLPAEVTAGLPRKTVWDLEQTLDGVVRTWLAGEVSTEEDVTRV